MRTELVLTEQDIDYLRDLWDHDRPLPEQYKNVNVYTKHIAAICNRAENSVRYWIHGDLISAINLGPHATRTSYGRFTLPLHILWQYRPAIKNLKPGRRSDL